MLSAGLKNLAESGEALIITQACILLAVIMIFVLIIYLRDWDTRNGSTESELESL